MNSSSKRDIEEGALDNRRSLAANDANAARKPSASHAEPAAAAAGDEPAVYVDPRLLPNDLHRGGGASKAWSIALIVLSAIGMAASVSLLVEEYNKLADPTMELGCDINPLVGCGASLLSPQAHLFYVPNSLIGTLAYGALILIGVLLMLGKKMPAILWWAMTAGGVGAWLFVFYFVYESIVNFQTLCPFCLIIWIVSLPVGMMLVSHNLQRIIRPDKPLNPVHRLVVSERWLLLAAVYVILAAVVLFGLRDKIAMVI